MTFDDTMRRRQAAEREARRLRYARRAVLWLTVAVVAGWLALMLAPALLEMVGDSLEMKGMME